MSDGCLSEELSSRSGDSSSHSLENLSHDDEKSRSAKKGQSWMSHKVRADSIEDSLSSA